ncbi:hypothetical protein M407DRAFT_21613 [Tulasnella calospora MUT 4182]|uniref:Uncharacterized protein n=1 Tax=Tulasnella calospora MUT 4182 TaxID=1051891 RepID=A0A0C3M6E8_9AGAM|nr:hypothetical protein M407DRAFT_21613 [Tulasnella calospora MUT 4182]
MLHHATTPAIPLQENASSLYATPAVLRYFDHIQNLPSIRNVLTTPSPVPLDALIESTTKLEWKATEPTKKKAKKVTVADAKSETTVDSKAAVSGSAPVKAEASGSSGQPKERKERKGT